MQGLFKGPCGVMPGSILPTEEDDWQLLNGLARLFYIKERVHFY